MELSVIIVSYNVRYFLEQCLISVLKASQRLECEIFVVDNNSTDGSCSMVAHQFPCVKLLMNHVNKGFSAANNQALKLAAGRYILLLNPDTIVEENTFESCIRFMDSYPDAGAAGVRMINGRGKLLPESKRALPTPRTAFFKMSGLAFIFPRSRFFNQYYLGHLDNSGTAPADIISGAFMFLRKEAVLKTGLLDEDFFMYGEDVDYSYRLRKAGYTNYYYPEIKIIHYKGQSTKKEDIGSVVNFYKAMAIFVRKHYSKDTLKGFIHLIQIAIFISALLSVMRKYLKRALLPITDGIIIYFGYILAATIWAGYKFGPDYHYPSLFTEIIIPGYTIVVITAIFLFSGYRIPARHINSVKGLITGTLVILVIYAMLPNGMRFSRAVILIGCFLTTFMVPLYRLLVSLIMPSVAENPLSWSGKTVIVSDSEGYARIRELLLSSSEGNIISGRVSIRDDDMSGEVLGNLNDLREILRVNKIREIIYSTRGLSSSRIIESMYQVSDQNITIRIASADEKYLLGSKDFIRTNNAVPLIGSLFRKRK